MPAREQGFYLDIGPDALNHQHARQHSGNSRQIAGELAKCILIATAYLNPSIRVASACSTPRAAHPPDLCWVRRPAALLPLLHVVGMEIDARAAVQNSLWKPRPFMNTSFRTMTTLPCDIRGIGLSVQ